MKREHGIEAKQVHNDVNLQRYIRTPKISDPEFRARWGLRGEAVVASGGYHQPIIPRMAARIPKGVLQLHSEQYRNPAALPDGTVLVVGFGQSGAQIAEDLHLAGRKVVLATGNAPRCARLTAERT